MGATGFADDFVFLAPVRPVLSLMARVCGDYGRQHIMIFSTDSVPSKSMRECMFFCGHRNVRYVDQIELDVRLLLKS